jgi:hypothetical protein
MIKSFKSQEALTDLRPDRPIQRRVVPGIREQTTVPLQWVSDRLQMGHYTRVTQAISRVARKPTREQKRVKRKADKPNATAAEKNMKCHDSRTQ